MLKQNEMAKRVYKQLSYCYLNSPELPHLQSIHQWCNNALINEKELPDNITLELKLIKSSLEPKISGELVHTLKGEYVRLIRSPSKINSPPPPYESVYLEGTVWGDSTVDVIKRYAEYSLQQTDKYKGEPPDHIGLELQFMSSLCEKEKNASQKELEKLQRAELDFLCEHLTKWFKLYKETAKKYSLHSFYEGIFKLTDEWIKLHKQYLETALKVKQN